MKRPLRPRPPGRGDVRLHEDVREEADGGRSTAFAEVHAIARNIPRGRVMTYGQIAELLIQRLSPRAVGWAMHGCPKNVPWQRVVNASGGCSTERMPDIPLGLQRALLEAEGVVFRESGTIDLDRYRFSPKGRGGGPSRRPPQRSRRRTR